MDVWLVVVGNFVTSSSMVLTKKQLTLMVDHGKSIRFMFKDTEKCSKNN